MNEFVIAAKEEDLSRKIKAYCSVCKQPIRDNVDLEKVITYARCVQRLLCASKEVKLQAVEVFRARADEEAARSIESFIIPEEANEIAILKKHCHLRPKLGHFRGNLPHIFSRSKTI